MGGIIGGAIGAVTNVIAGNKAADAQKQSAKLQAQRYKETKELLSPYTGVGSRALKTYETGVGLNGIEAQRQYFNDFQTDPGFKAAEDYAVRSIENSNALRGRGYGGNLIAGLGDYLQKNMLGAYQTRQSQLGGLVDTGRQSAQSLAGFGQQSAQAQGQNLANAGYYQGAGIAGAGQSFLNAFGGQQQQAGYNQGASGGGLASAGNFLSMFG